MFCAEQLASSAVVAFPDLTHHGTCTCMWLGGSGQGRRPQHLRASCLSQALQKNWSSQSRSSNSGMHTLWQVNWAKATAAMQGKLPFKHDSNIDQSANTSQASYTSQHTSCCTQVCIVVPRHTLWQVPAHIMANTCMHHGTYAGTKTQASLCRHKEA
jgi:hypothetical protein